MYGFNDHLKGMPFTALSALRQGSSRYSARMAEAGSIEHAFGEGVTRLTLPLPTGPRHVHRFVRGPRLLREGDVVGGWEVLWLPGHADGHIALAREGVLVCGDVLLAGISPAVGLYPESRPDPIADYLRTLERIAELDLDVAYPGHGESVRE